MSIEIDPLELGFHRPFTSEVSQILKIKNPNLTHVAFKVKTTAPKQYCVRPNCGRIEPGKEVEVLVLLQAMKEDPPVETKCRDKFLVQSVAVAGDNEDSVGGPTWRNVDEADKTAIQEKKIKVSYLPPSPGSNSTSKVTGTPNKYSISPYKSEGASPSQNNLRSPSPETTYTPDNRSSNRQTFGISNYDAIKSSPASNKTNPPGQGYEDVLARLSKAEEIVAQYEKDDILRKTKVSHEKISKEGTMNLDHSIQHGSQGVPLQVVAILCFTSFLLAYLLF
ncbi:Vesicle-associated membrane protein-associated protein C16G5.05c [Erysiphe neolycopersici]|uniref:Vesicle-associated membrane protein-associated protein C16G5.05c n=1 Tax=Erysiphe neolycopersici TaxID=212602 RepID=A0A420I5Q7_9PEZI|nr:Vesicle-associated membrane protein-associated protein C16G5.05c [Erysiphe neolycopersici]